MKKFFRKTLSLFIISVVSLAAFSNLALASNYNLAFSFEKALEGEPRYFDGQNIAFEANAESHPFKHKLNKTYNATLHRVVAWSKDDKIGTVTLMLDTRDIAEWSNVGPGEYYIYLTKENDGITLSDNNARMYNY